jgi:Leucine-rich repeat (LRR) protein
MKRECHPGSMSVVAAAAGTLLLVMVLICGDSTRTRIDEWTLQHLSPVEIRNIQQLGHQILESSKRNDAIVDQRLHAAIRALSIREAAGLGMMLLDAGYDEIVPWIRLSAEREQQGIVRVAPLLKRCHSVEPWTPALQTTVRGPAQLREICGTDLLTEATGIAFRSEDDDGLSVAIDLENDELNALLDLPGLERVWIESASITDEGVQKLASLPRLQEIHLVSCSRITDQSVVALARPGLRTLDLSGAAEIGDRGIAALSRCPNLESLNLSSTGMTSKSLPTIAGCRGLRDLSLSHTKVHEGLNQLHSLRRLERLRMGYLGSAAQPVPWQTLQFLSECKHLKLLELDQTAVQRLELKHLHHLESLSFGHCSLRSLVLVDLPRLPSLEMFSDWSQRDLHRLDQFTLQGLPELRRVLLRGLSESACDGLAHGLADSERITAVYLANSPVTDSLASALGKLPELELLDISSAEITGTQLQGIVVAPRLDFLMCCGRRLTSEDCMAFGGSSLSRLTIHRLDVDLLTESACWQPLSSLHLQNCRIGVLSLSQLPKLNGIDLNQVTLNQLSVARCEQLKRISLLTVGANELYVDTCPALESVFTGFESKLGKVTLSDLVRLSSLTIQERASVEELQLSNLPRLRSVSFWAAPVTTEIIRQLLGLTALANLDVSHTGLGDEAAEIIGQINSIEQLSASSAFTRRGLEQLQKLPHLKSLNLYRRSDADWSAEDAKGLFQRRAVVFTLR